MSDASPAHVNEAHRLLACEGAAGADRGDSQACAAAAERVYEKLRFHLDPLAGPLGVQAIFARSVKLVRRQFPGFAEAVAITTPAQLRECLECLDSAVVEATAAALFGTFFTLLATFIGERLTSEVLQRAWPTVERSASKETKR